MLLTIFPRVTCNRLRLWPPAVAVSAQDFNLVGDKGGRVAHEKHRSVDHVLREVIFHPELAVLHFVLKAWAVALDR